MKRVHTRRWTTKHQAEYSVNRSAVRPTKTGTPTTLNKTKTSLYKRSYYSLAKSAASSCEKANRILFCPKLPVAECVNDFETKK